MAKYQQAGREITISTPLGDDALLLNGFTGREAISAPFRFELELLSPASSPVAFDKLLGQAVTIKLALPGGQTRPINGVVVKLSQGPRLQGTAGGATFLRYRAEIAPKFWLLTRKAQCRIFQQMTVPDILKKVLTGLTIDDQIQGTFDPRDYCVQYRETDFDFASRLMEEEGIFYFFKHTDGRTRWSWPTLPAPMPTSPGHPPLRRHLRRCEVRGPDPQLGEDPGAPARQVHPLGLLLRAARQEPRGQPADPRERAGRHGQPQAQGRRQRQLEIYDYPGGYAQRFDGIAPGGGDQAGDLQKIFEDNTRTVGIRMQQEALAGLDRHRGRRNCRHLVAGCKFTLDGHFNADGSYVLTQVEHAADLGGAYLQQAAQSEGGFTYYNPFQCIPVALPFRCPTTTPRAPDRRDADRRRRRAIGRGDLHRQVRPREGPVPLGPPGQERRQQLVLGPRRHHLGGQAMGDDPHPPDRPGSGRRLRGRRPRPADHHRQRLQRRADAPLHPARQQDPERHHLAEHASRVRRQLQPAPVRGQERLRADHCPRREGLQPRRREQRHAERRLQDSQTCPDGSQTIAIYKDRTTTIETGNESLTVKKGNRTTTISEGDDTHTVTKGKRTIDVKSDDTHTVKTGNRAVNVNTGNDTHTVKTGNRTVNVNTGNDTHEVKTGNRAVTIDMGNDTLTIKMGNQTTKLDLGASTTEAMQGITLKVGSNSIEITRWASRSRG